MNYVDISEWCDSIRVEAPAAPNPLITDKIRLASMEVCKRTMVSRETLDLIDIEAGVKQYIIEPPSSCLKIWRVLWMKTINGVSPLTPVSRHNLISMGVDWERATGEAATDWVQIKNDIVQLWPAPTIDLDEELDVQRELLRLRSIMEGFLDIHDESELSLYMQLEPKLRYENTLYCFKEMFKALSTRRPLVVEVEDIF